MIATICVSFDWIAKQDLVITSPQYSSYNLNKVKSSLNTYTKIEIRQLTWAWIRASPELARALKVRSNPETGSWIKARDSQST